MDSLSNGLAQCGQAYEAKSVPLIQEDLAFVAKPFYSNGLPHLGHEGYSVGDGLWLEALPF